MLTNEFADYWTKLFTLTSIIRTNTTFLSDNFKFGSSLNFSSMTYRDAGFDHIKNIYPFADITLNICINFAKTLTLRDRIW